MTSLKRPHCNESDSDEDLFSIVRTSSAPVQTIVLDEEDSSEEKDSANSSDEEPVPTKQKKLLQPAWQDSDDVRPRAAKRIAEIFGATPDFLNIVEDKNRSRTSSSSSTSDSNDDSDDDNMKPGGREPPKTEFFDVLSREKNPLLKKNLLDIRQCTDANIDHRSKYRISTVLFHPKIEALMTASEDTSISLFKIDGKSNEKLFNKNIKKFPIKCARFSPDGNQVIVTANRNKFNVLDLISNKLLTVNTIAGLPLGEKLSTFEISPNGQQIVMAGLKGRLYIFDARSRVKTCSSQVTGSIESMTFSHNGQFLYLTGSSRTISIMDIRNTRTPFLRSWEDDGSLGGRSIAASSNDRWIACGSHSGVVNLYSWIDTQRTEHPQPTKSIMNLTTSCTELKFNSTSEILAMSSSIEPRAVKLFHVASRSVFANFPERGKSLATITSMDLSPNSGYLCLGQQNGHASLYRLMHYPNY